MIPTSPWACEPEDRDRNRDGIGGDCEQEVSGASVAAPGRRATGARRLLRRPAPAAYCRPAICRAPGTTPNIHFCTIEDFRDLCITVGVKLERALALDTWRRRLRLTRHGGSGTCSASRRCFCRWHWGSACSGSVRFCGRSRRGSTMIWRVPYGGPWWMMTEEGDGLATSKFRNQGEPSDRCGASSIKPNRYVLNTY
jgi:hypothetical protein